MTAPSEFTVGEVASMTGLSTHTLRVWERRYDALKPARTAARQRRYSREDVEFLLRVKQLSRAGGRSIKLALEEARGDLPLDLPGTPPPEMPASVQSAGIWRSVADLSQDPIAVLDGRGRIIDCNVALARLAGRLRGQLQGSRFVDLIDPHDRAKAARVYRRPLREHPAWELNVRTPRARGLFSFDCRPLREGDRWMVACSGHDLTHAGTELWPATAEEAPKPAAAPSLS
jgi:PAS domain S-box-containing protein